MVGNSPLALILMTGSLGFYVGGGFGAPIGFAAAGVFVVSVLASNVAILTSGGSAHLTTIGRWVLYIGGMAMAALLRAKGCDVTGACHRLFSL